MNVLYCISLKRTLGSQRSVEALVWYRALQGQSFEDLPLG